MTKQPITNDQILAYAAGHLDAETAERVEAHLRRDAKAAKTVAVYRLAAARTAGDDTVAPPAEAIQRAKAIFRSRPAPAVPSWPERIEAVIASLVFDSRLQPMAVRHAERTGGFQLGFEVEDAEIDLRAERLGAAGNRWRVIGQVSRDGDRPEALEISALPSGTTRPCLVEWADEHAMFTLELDAGSYDLRLSAPGSVIVLPGIRVG